MTLAELKKSIHERIDSLDDPDFLEMLNDLISQKNRVFQIPEEHLADIEQGKRDIENGNFITLEEFEKRNKNHLKD